LTGIVVYFIEKCALYTRPQDGFIDVGNGGGVLCGKTGRLCKTRLRILIYPPRRERAKNADSIKVRQEQI
jgi:hypothetical protein